MKSLEGKKINVKVRKHLHAHKKTGRSRVVVPGRVPDLRWPEIKRGRAAVAAYHTATYRPATEVGRARNLTRQNERRERIERRRAARVG